MTGTDWLDQLEQKAAAATPGPWKVGDESPTHPGMFVVDAPGHDEVTDYLDAADAEFIAAANPTTILHLIESNRRLAQVAQSDRETAQDFADEIVAAHAERDALAARLAAVEALADEWQRELDEYRIRDENARYCWAVAAREVRAALAAPTDTTKEN